MCRITGPRRSYGHRVYPWLLSGKWEIAWTIDRKVAGSRLRWTTTFRRLTDYAGAVRFARKHGLPLPEPEARP